MESSYSGEIQEAENLFKLGRDSENENDIESAIFLFQESARRFINILKQEKEEKKRKFIKEMVSLPLDRATYLKNKVNEGNKKANEEMQNKMSQISVRPSEAPITEFSYELYKQIGDDYYNRLQKKKTLLQPAITAYVIHAENYSMV